MQRTVSGVTYALYQGHTNDNPIQPDIESKSVSVGLLDGLAKFHRQKISTPLYSALRTGEVIHLILDAIGWTAGRDIDPGVTVIPWWWEEQTDALEALTKVVNSEGPPALLTVGSAGEMVFRDRHHRILRSASTTSQATWRGAGVEPVIAKNGLVYDNGWSGIVNDVTFAVAERRPSGELAAVWTSDAPITVSDGETLELTAQGTDPFFGAIPPVAGTDYTLLSGAVTITLTRTSGQAVTVRILATGGPATLQGLQVRAYPVPVVRTTQVHAEDVASIGSPANPKYGRRSWPLDAPWAGVHDARAIALIILAHRAERLPVVTVKFVGSNDTRLAHMLARDLSDRVTTIEPELGINGDFYIDRIGHSFNGDAGHETMFVTEKAPAQVADVFILGSATNGVLGTNRLGKRGLDDPATVFILGSGSNGVLGENTLGT
jgi:hypothetical protein